MFKKALCAVAIASAVASVPAQAETLGSFVASNSGPLNFSLNVLDMGTTTYSTSVNCNSVASCNAASGGSVGDGFIAGEDSWGVFKINNIDIGANTWNSGDSGQFLRGMFYGVQDQSVSYDAGSSTYHSTGTSGFLDIYIFNSNVNANAFGQLPGQRTGASSFTGFTGGTLWLRLAFDSFSSSFKLLTPTTVSADLTSFLSVIDDSLQAGAAFDTDTLVNANNGLSDISVTGQPQCNFNAQGGTTCGTWTTTGTVNGQGLAIPEPGTIALAGLGLIGVAAMRRRKLPV